MTQREPTKTMYTLEEAQQIMRQEQKRRVADAGYNALWKGLVWIVGGYWILKNVLKGGK